ncbi:MAG: WD40 repeat domain-containing protein [Gemmataceae bacterium]|nr:WD40 repeat domain-containing protein [Gemmataceae bacterium]
MLPHLPRTCLAAVLTLTLAFATLDGGAQEPAARRRPVPDKTARVAAAKLVDEIFQQDFANAKDADARTRLAATLLQQARDSRRDDLPAAYVLYERARAAAAAGGNYQLALQTADEQAAEFDVPALDLKADALTAAGKVLVGEEPNRSLVDVALRLVGDAIDADNYPAALRFGEVAENAAKKAKKIPLVNAVRKRLDEVATMQKGYSRLQPYLDRLKNDPKDAEANLKLGEYYGLLKGKWEKALPLLARGGDAALRAQAALDLGRPKEGKPQLAVADGWWNLAEKYKDSVRLNMLRRAAHWYEQAALGLSGLSRTKALKRLDRVAALAQGSVPVKAGPVGPIKVFEGHTGEIRGVAFSPSGQHAVSGAKDETVRVWNVATGKQERVLKGHTKEVWGVAYHPNGRQVLSASWDTTARLWDAQTGKEVRVYRHPKDINSVAVARDGRWLLTGCDDGYVRLWDLNTGEETRRYSGHEGYVYGVAFSPDGRYVASGGQDRSVRVYELGTGKKVREITGPTAPTTHVAFSGDSRYVFACGDNAAHMWEIATGKEVKRFEGPTGSGYALGMAVSPDGRRLLTGHEDKSVRLWDVATGKEIQRFEGHTGQVICVAFSADGGRAISGSADNTVRLWGLPVR